MSERLAIFAEGLFTKHTGKTAHGVIRYGTREVVAVIDSTCAGSTASEVEPFCLKPVPIVATLDEALELEPDTLLIGVARWRTLAVAGKLQLFTNATSLGGCESLVEHRASVEGASPVSPQNLLRVSVGLEHVDDLIADFDQALDLA